MNYNKLTKKQLVELCKTYDFNLEVLDLMVHDMSDVQLSDISAWIDQLRVDLTTALVCNKIFIRPDGLTQDDVDRGWYQINLMEDDNED